MGIYGYCINYWRGGILCYNDEIKVLINDKQLTFNVPVSRNNSIRVYKVKIKKLKDEKRQLVRFENSISAKKVLFISKYSNKNLVSFANVLSHDKDAVMNSVTSKWGNGFVEENNKVKTIKRCMYGRAKIKLLSAKVIYG